MSTFFCASCGKHVEVEIGRLSHDDHNERPLGDAVCKECARVIATASSDIEGVIHLHFTEEIDLELNEFDFHPYAAPHKESKRDTLRSVLVNNKEYVRYEDVTDYFFPWK